MEVLVNTSDSNSDINYSIHSRGRKSNVKSSPKISSNDSTNIKSTSSGNLICHGKNITMKVKPKYRVIDSDEEYNDSKLHENNMPNKQCDINQSITTKKQVNQNTIEQLSKYNKQDINKINIKNRYKTKHINRISRVLPSQNRSRHSQVGYRYKRFKSKSRFSLL